MITMKSEYYLQYPYPKEGSAWRSRLLKTSVPDRGDRGCADCALPMASVSVR